MVSAQDTTTRTLKQVRQVRSVGVMIPIGKHPGAVAGTLTMETIRIRFRTGAVALDFISMAMNMARPHEGDLEALPKRSQKSGFGSERYLGSINWVSKSRPV